MIPEEIKRLLDSASEEDNNVGWELVLAQGITFNDVVDYVKNTKVPTNYVNKYRWNGEKYVRNDLNYDLKSAMDSYRFEIPNNIVWTDSGTTTGTDTLLNSYL